MKYSGRVFKGRQYGRTLGFPTANILIEDEGVSGIYAARVVIESIEYQAAVYADAHKKTLEVHILDFEGDAYGKELHVELLKKTRDDRSFASEDEARAVIAQDVLDARAFFAVL